MELRIRYAGRPHEPVTAEVPEDAPEMDVTAWARAVAYVCNGTLQVVPPGALTLMAIWGRGEAGAPPQLHPGDAVEVGDSRVLVGSVRLGQVVFTAPGPVIEADQWQAGAALYESPQLRTLPGGGPYPSVRDGRWG